MREVAERAGVAMSSVSRVLAGHPDVSPAMTEKVMRAVEDLDYREPHRPLVIAVRVQPKPSW